jgi:hypothetical protein
VIGEFEMDESGSEDEVREAMKKFMETIEAAIAAPIAETEKNETR